MYSVCTGPSPFGGSYCTGNPGAGSTVVRDQKYASSPMPTVSSAIQTNPVTDRPRILSHVYGHGRVV